MQEAVKSAGESQGRIAEVLAAVLKKKSLPTEIASAISGAFFPLADQIRQGAVTFQTEREVVQEVIAALKRVLLSPGRELIKETQWDSMIKRLSTDPGQPGFRFSLVGSDTAIKPAPVGGAAATADGEKKGKEGKKEKAKSKDKSQSNDAVEDKTQGNDAVVGQDEKDGAPGQSDEAKEGKKSDKKKDKGKRKSSAPDDGRQERKSETGAAASTSEVGGHVGVGGRLSMLKAKGTRCEVYSEGDWWQAKVLKNRVEEGREQVYVHYKGASAEDDEWIDLQEDLIRAPGDDWDMPIKGEVGERIEIRVDDPAQKKGAKWQAATVTEKRCECVHESGPNAGQFSHFAVKVAFDGAEGQQLITLKRELVRLPVLASENSGAEHGPKGGARSKVSGKKDRNADKDAEDNATSGKR